MLKHEKLNLNTRTQFKCIILHKRRGNKARIIEKIGRNIIFDLLGYISTRYTKVDCVWLMRA